jgi:hypothetical protein
VTSQDERGISPALRPHRSLPSTRTAYKSRTWRKKHIHKRYPGFMKRAKGEGERKADSRGQVDGSGKRSTRGIGSALTLKLQLAK